MRALDALRSPRGLAAATMTALVFLWIIVPAGAIVRLTGSGLGCPDWPLCEGRVVPEQAGHAVIEYANRLLSGVVVLVVIAVWLLARRAPGASRALRTWALGAALCSAAQAPLGAVTVLSGLHPLAVGSHFMLSMVALACGTMAHLHARDRRDGRARLLDRRRGPLAAITLGAAGLVLLTGVIVTAAGPHPGDSEVIRRWGDLGALATVHVRAAFAFTALAVLLAAWLWREGGLDRATRRLGVASLPLIALQITIGEYQFRAGLPWEVVVAHVSIAALLWAVMVGFCWGVLRPAAQRAPLTCAPARPAGTRAVLPTR
ncbi:MAG: COX15/CtaA family protein [Miltoncostaeaceae bacterium]